MRRLLIIISAYSFLGSFRLSSQQCSSSHRSATVAPQVLACSGAFFTLLNYVWCVTDLLAVIVSIPIIVLVLLPACMRISKATYFVAAGFCLANVVLEILSCFCHVSVGRALREGAR